jgi:rubredoxin
MRKRRYNIEVPTWTCPHCGFVHRPADLLRVNSNDLRCKQCKQTFPEQSTAPDREASTIGLRPLSSRAQLTDARLYRNPTHDK